MSDPQASKPHDPIGEPVIEPGPDEDVVVRANAGLADADAARENRAPDAFAERPEPTADERVAINEPVAPVDEPVAPVTDDPLVGARASADDPATRVYDEHAAAAPSEATESTPWYDRPEAETVAPVAPVAPVVVAAREPAPAPQPIFVQAPELPRPRGNRGAAGAIGLLAAIAFAVLYLVAWLGFGLISGDVTTETVAESAVQALGTWSLWVPTVVFFVAFWLLGAIINRGPWGNWVIFGLLVGIASYLGHILGQLFQAPFWTLTSSEGATLAEGELLAPLAIAAFVIGRELTVWFGAWVAARGARVSELNVEARREYERTLEAGPQLVRP